MRPDLEAIWKRLEGVKWPLFSRNAGVRLIHEGRELKLADCHLWKSPGGVPEPQFAVADFFAAAPTDIAALLAWVEKLEAVRGPLPALLKAIIGSRSGKNLKAYYEPVMDALAALEE